MAKQVFFDPLQARWRRIRRVVDAAALAFSLLVIFFIYSALRSEPLPDLSWLTEKKPYHALKEKEKEKAREKRRLATVARTGHRHQSRKAPSQLKLNSEQGVRAAFYVSWDPASFSSLREYARQIDLLFPTWLQVLTPDGHLQASIRKPTPCSTWFKDKPSIPSTQGDALSEGGRHGHGSLSGGAELRWHRLCSGHHAIS